MISLPQRFGKYVLTERIAIGGMAEIFKAKAAGLGGFEKLLAIKRLHPRYSDDQDFIRMLMDEAKLAVQLSHMNIGQIFDLGREEDLVYIAMELIEGRDLYRLLKRLAELDELMPIPAAVFIALEMLSGLDYAHRKIGTDGVPLQLIHRDISPQNILLSWEGEVKIVDFGIAKAAKRAVETQSGVIKGKFYYMSPEQARGDKLDQRCDIFSAGIVLYEMLTGTLMYGEEDDVTLLSRVRRADITPPRHVRAEISIDLERILLKALSREPRRRFQTAHEFHQALFQLHYSMPQPFDRVALGVMMREKFGQAPLAQPVSHEQRFLSRVDYINGGAELSSDLLMEEDSADRLFDDDEDTLFHPAAGTPAHLRREPLRADLFDDEPTFSADIPELFDNPDDDSTSVYEGHLDGFAPPAPLPAPPLPRAPRGSPPPPDMDGVEMLDPDDAVVVDSYGEITHMSEADTVTGPDSVGPIDAADELTDVPLSINALFVVGLVVILMLGGTIAAVGTALITPSKSTEFSATAESDEESDVEAFGRRDGPDDKGSEDKPASTPASEASLSVEVAGPPLAEVKLEGFKAQPSPARFEGISVGKSYTLEVTAPNYTDHEETVLIERKTAITRTVTLAQRMGKLNISTSPSGATITIAGEERDEKTPSLTGDLAYGMPYRVELDLDGYESYSEVLLWRDGDKVVKSIDKPLTKRISEVASNDVAPPTTPNRRTRPAPRTNRSVPRRNTQPQRSRRPAPTDDAAGGYGFISVSAKPVATVSIDGKRIGGYTPLIRYRTKVGFHTVRVVFGSLGGKTKQKTAAVKKGKNINVFFSP